MEATGFRRSKSRYGFSPSEPNSNPVSDPALMKQISRSRAFYQSGRKGLTFEDVFGEPVTPAKKRRSA